MRGVAFVGGLVLAGVAVVCGSPVVSPSFAANLPSPNAPAATTPNEERFLIFSGFDGWQSGSFGHAGVTWSPQGLNQEGFVAKFMAGSGTYKYLAGSINTTGYVTLLDAAPGWRFKWGTTELTVYGGIDVQSHRLRPDDLNNSSRGFHIGARAGADLWMQPTPTTMASASVSFASVGDGHWSRLAYGWRMFDKIYLGPEAHALGDETYRQWRLGIHATALKVGNFEWSIGAGFVEDSDERSGFYGRVGVLLRR